MPLQVLAASGTAFASLHTRQQAGIEIGLIGKLHCYANS
jgi:hypothetical protein